MTGLYTFILHQEQNIICMYDVWHITFAEETSLESEISDLTDQWSMLYQEGDITGLTHLYTPDCRVLIPDILQKNGRDGKDYVQWLI